MSRSRAYTRLQLKRAKRKAREVIFHVWGRFGNFYTKEHPELLPEAIGKRAKTRVPCPCIGCQNHLDGSAHTDHVSQGVFASEEELLYTDGDEFIPEDFGPLPESGKVREKPRYALQAFQPPHAGFGLWEECPTQNAGKYDCTCLSEWVYYTGLGKRAAYKTPMGAIQAMQAAEAKYLSQRRLGFPRLYRNSLSLRVFDMDTSTVIARCYIPHLEAKGA